MTAAILLSTTLSSTSRYCCLKTASAFLPSIRGKRRLSPPSIPFSSLAYTSSSSSSLGVSASPTQLNEEIVQKNKDETKPAFMIYYNDVYEVKLPPNHRFPMSKYRQVRELVQSKVNDLSREEQERVNCEFRISPLATTEQLSTTHCPSYIQRFLHGNMTEQEIRNVGFPWSKQGVNRALSSVGGTVAAANFVCEALQQRKERNEEKEVDYPPIWAAHVAGGTHHAFHDYGEGFCVFSDIAVAANVIRQLYPDLIKRILIIDLDVHQGNGNAVLFQNRNDVMTFSLHCQSNYFSKKEQSDLDVEVPSGCNDETYLATLRHWLGRIEREGGDYDFIFYQAGVDVLEDDRLGRMALSREGVERRNEMVFEFATRGVLNDSRRENRNIPMVITMGGGYPKDRNDWTPILEAHSNVYFQAHQYVSDFGENIVMEDDAAGIL